MPNQPYPTTSSLNQGGQFAKMTSTFHGGAKSKKSRRGRRAMRGGSSFTPYAEYPTSMDYGLPADLRDLARIAPLDAKFVELPAIERAAGVPMAGGSRRKTRRGSRGGAYANIDSPSMLLSSPAEEAAARLNPQWYTENTVIPDFRGPLPVPGATVPAPSPPPAAPAPPAKGGARKSRKYSKNRKSSKYSKYSKRR